MKVRHRAKLVPYALAIVTAAATVATPLGLAVPRAAHADAVSVSGQRWDCSRGWSLCPDVYNAEQVWGRYVGHDEPVTLFYSKQPGSGNQMAYRIKLPTDPPVAPPAGTDNFQLHVAFWVGMSMCATESYPEQITTCTPDSDSNILDPKVSPKHAGEAFMEMQFYPPGWVTWPAGISCDATKWCAALTVTSYAINPVTGAQLNSTCASRVGVEYQNFAFITLDGKSQAPANPVDATAATHTPDPKRDLFMSPGDMLTVTLHDTTHGLQVVIDDVTSGQSGSMTSSAANGYGQVEFAPPPSTACKNIPYDFHPMYSTSSEQTRTTWTAHSYGIAFADEIGHFDYCSAVGASGNCRGKEGSPGDTEPSDVDDAYCFPAPAPPFVPVAGCINTNTGFDGVPYQPVWPDGDTQHHPSPILFDTPRTGSSYNINYDRMAFEADLPLIEAGAPQNCNNVTGAHCTLIPLTDDRTPANFYPFYTAANLPTKHCIWTLGNDIPGLTSNDFGKNRQYGDLLPLTFTNPGGSAGTFYYDFRQVISPNPCTT